MGRVRMWCEEMLLLGEYWVLGLEEGLGDCVLRVGTMGL